MSNQSMKASSILVINVTIRQLRKVTYLHMSNQNMKASSILVNNVTIRQLRKMPF